MGYNKYLVENTKYTSSCFYDEAFSPLFNFSLNFGNLGTMVTSSSYTLVPNLFLCYCMRKYFSKMNFKGEMFWKPEWKIQKCKKNDNMYKWKHSIESKQCSQIWTTCSSILHSKIWLLGRFHNYGLRSNQRNSNVTVYFLKSYIITASKP